MTDLADLPVLQRAEIVEDIAEKLFIDLLKAGKERVTVLGGGPADLMMVAVNVLNAIPLTVIQMSEDYSDGDPEAVENTAKVMLPILRAGIKELEKGK